ncbi:Mitochondrial import inner membrane translocase subunit tim23 [Lodderomyces elongisporus]|uniref:Mitochondrial import inner membrane translocase subunit TIM23 n=1 Tax=Lodderomyces elongisporus (strain ATCC 11503 / CBS 2605 / JCM 1781 / NBRC 1676 / NRRL YB-4239) TaxID=379508 RepID=A5DYF7_LODEL|nr:Mitochondrial import inner membrane translocase subunit tim23 [Lodderomyces elongisporus]EDK44215.1 mitochondrial import inner membrane translocase subunit TIM23 [Lodderomyces elongisporus NRRL YB-4239]WLF79483.1 Mitochondrial import inner membrane translocase subunit tim23 [Lodderomyces elongisporus]
MSWIFGKPTQSQDDQSNDQLKQRLGFDPREVSDVNTIISSPSSETASSLNSSLLLHPLAGLEKGIEYLDLEEEKLNTVEGSKGLIPSRSWTDDLCYGTGAVYLLGLGIGGLFGLQHGLSTLPQDAPGKVKLNHILNNITKRGPFLGNSAGVLALTYNLIDSTIDAVREKHEDVNSVAAGALAGALFRSSRGLKPMAYSSVMMAGAAGVWCALKRSIHEDNQVVLKE